MKQIFISFFLLITCSIAFGQKFTLQELTNLNKMDWDEFDSYVIAKGYEYNKTEDLEFVESKSYGYKQKGEESPYFISKTVAKNKNTKLVAYQTTNSQDYLLIKSQLKNSGFKFAKTEARGQTILLIYMKGDIQLTLATFKVQQNSGDTFAGYEISIRTN